MIRVTRTLISLLLFFLGLESTAAGTATNHHRFGRHTVLAAAIPNHNRTTVLASDQKKKKQSSSSRTTGPKCVNGVCELQETHPSSSNTNVRGGGFVNGEDEEDYYDGDYYDEDAYDDQEEERPQPKRNRPPPGRRPLQPPPQYTSRRGRSSRRGGPLNTAASLAKKTVDLTTSAAFTTLKGSGKAAFYLVSPKHVTRQEVWGVWRLDQQVGQLPDGPFVSCAANVEFNPRGDCITKYKDEDFHKTPYMFKEKSWPKSCTIEFEADAFQGPNDERPVRMLYKGYFRRKVADRSVIKIVGKIYEIRRKGIWRGGGGRKVQVGTFVARRRIMAPPSRASRRGRSEGTRRMDPERSGADSRQEENEEYDNEEYDDYDEYEEEEYDDDEDEE